MSYSVPCNLPEQEAAPSARRTLKPRRCTGRLSGLSGSFLSQGTRLDTSREASASALSTELPQEPRCAQNGSSAPLAASGGHWLSTSRCQRATARHRLAGILPVSTVR